MPNLGPISGGGSGTPLTDPNIAHIRSDGSGAGNGSPSSPFSTIQQAITAGFSTFNVGQGVGGNVDVSAGASAFYFCCNNSSIGNITTGGTSKEFTFSGSAAIAAINSVLDDSAAGNIEVAAGAGIVIGEILATGAGTDQSGGNITLVGPFLITGQISASGTGAGPPGVITLSQGVSIPTPSPDAATVIGATINGAFYANNYP